MKELLFHPEAAKIIELLRPDARTELAALLNEICLGRLPGMPQCRPMPVVAVGVYELRIRDRYGNYRFFCFFKSSRGILLFHAFVKKSATTPHREIWRAKVRLKELL